MSAYDKVKQYFQDLITKTLKGKDAYVNVLQKCVHHLDGIAESYAEVGDSKVASKFIAIRNKVLTLSRRVENGKVTSIDEIKAQVDSLLFSLIEINPKTISSGKQKAGIKDQSKAFAGFDKKRVHLEIAEGKLYKLEQAPILLLFKNKVTPIQKRILSSMNAHFYQGTNGVSIPAIPILILNKDLIPKSKWVEQAKAVFRRLGRPNLAIFENMAVEKRNCVAFPVFTSQDAEVMAIIMFDATQSKELWVD